MLEEFGTMLKSSSTSFLNYKEDGKPKSGVRTPVYGIRKGWTMSTPKMKGYPKTRGIRL